MDETASNSEIFAHSIDALKAMTSVGHREGFKMDLMNRLSKQANELWQKQAACMDQARK